MSLCQLSSLKIQAKLHVAGKRVLLVAMNLNHPEVEAAIRNFVQEYEPLIFGPSEANNWQRTQSCAIFQGASWLRDQSLIIDQGKWDGRRSAPSYGLHVSLTTSDEQLTSVNLEKARRLEGTNQTYTLTLAWTAPDIFKCSPEIFAMGSKAMVSVALRLSRDGVGQWQETRHNIGLVKEPPNPPLSVLGFFSPHVSLLYYAEKRCLQAALLAETEDAEFAEIFIKAAAAAAKHTLDQFDVADGAMVKKRRLH